MKKQKKNIKLLSAVWELKYPEKIQFWIVKRMGEIMDYLCNNCPWVSMTNNTCTCAQAVE